MCIWNSHGHFLKALTKWYECSPPPLQAEAFGLKEGIFWLGELGLSKVQIEIVVECIIDRTKN